ncbi:glycosyltransferase [Mucilaginibacter robiniae]|uniref:Glycosyltransferase n=1 Tax=Mucilaginibacter robiniae TaxID=2728022 RepID=A0A7L5DW58_9SPHI|nr:glycosyltransferase family 2 protein [Mucilaginibacter robiniae]QJD95325.1 glycosyltransferase [Mucilaginibacter robiniae]
MKQGGTRIWANNHEHQPMVSIIIVTFNASKYLDECLQSIFKQSFTDYELIIKDGSSTDGTLAILEKYQQQITYWESSPDQGIYDAMNQAVKLTRGRWIYFLGADDRLLEGFSTMCQQLQQPDTLYYGNCMSDKGLLGGQYSAYKIAKYAICQQALFYPKVVFQKYQYHTQYHVYADYALNLQCWGDKAIIKNYFPISVAWYTLTGYSAVAQDNLFKQHKPLLIKQSMGWLMYLRFLYKRRKEQRRPGSNFY